MAEQTAPAATEAPAEPVEVLWGFGGTEATPGAENTAPEASTEAPAGEEKPAGAADELFAEVEEAGEAEGELEAEETEVAEEPKKAGKGFEKRIQQLVNQRRAVEAELSQAKQDAVDLQTALDSMTPIQKQLWDAYGSKYKDPMATFNGDLQTLRMLEQLATAKNPDVIKALQLAGVHMRGAPIEGAPAQKVASDKGAADTRVEHLLLGQAAAHLSDILTKSPVRPELAKILRT